MGLNYPRELELADARMRAALERDDYDQALMYAGQCKTLAEHIMYRADEPPYDVFTFVDMNNAMWYYRDQIELIKRLKRRRDGGFLSWLLG